MRRAFLMLALLALATTAVAYTTPGTGVRWTAADLVAVAGVGRDIGQARAVAVADPRPWVELLQQPVIDMLAIGAHERIVSRFEALNAGHTFALGFGFVAGFAISLGPVMWVLFSELFPNRVRGIAISFVGLINSAISFLVQLVFPWELENLGNSTTFLIYGIFAVIGLIIVWRLLPETKGKSLEQLEAQLVHKP